MTLPRSPRRWVWSCGVAVLFAWWVAARMPAAALPPVVVERHVVLSIDPLIVEGDKTRAGEPPEPIEVGPDSPGEATMSIPWLGGGAPAKVRVAARWSSSSTDEMPAVRCVATVEIAGREPIHAEREVVGEGTILFEIFDDGGRRLVLALRGEAMDRPVVHRMAKVGEPVRFLVAIERIDGERAVLLETNSLNTFVGQSVGYSFRRGRDADLEAVRLDLLPVSITGDLVTIQAGISGALPGAGGTALLSRHERIVASRRATSTLSATSGNPPAGYRFQVTPDF